MIWALSMIGFTEMKIVQSCGYVAELLVANGDGQWFVTMVTHVSTNRISLPLRRY
jgi:hypothetical protein